MKNRIKLSTKYFVFILAFCFKVEAREMIIPDFDSLDQKANAVILEDETMIEIEDYESAVYYVNRQILIKNNKADKHCRFIFSDTHFKNTKDIKAEIKDINGKLIKRLDSDDIKEAEFSPDAFYSGNKYKYFEINHFDYPFIISLSYKVKINSLLLWPGWYPEEDIPVLKSDYKLKIYPDVKFKYYTKGISFEPKISTEESFKTYYWELSNISPSLDEDYSDPEDANQIGLDFISEEFETDDYKGSSLSWNDFASWYRELTKDRYNLSKDAEKEILELTKNISDPKEKLKVLYNHLQRKFRYVAIEMGIAGWQPQAAEQVSKNRYGDCKDLSTYMISALNTIGIKSYPVLALTRDKGLVDVDKPSNRFNHCFVFVPFNSDSVWLECTAKYSTIDDMPYTIEGINALLVTDDEGVIVSTPQKGADRNKLQNTMYTSILSNGDLKFETTLTTSGNQKIYIRNILSSQNLNDKKQILSNLLSKNYPNIDIDSVEELNNFENDKEISIRITGKYKKFLPQKNQLLFINPQIVNRKTSQDLPKEKTDERKLPVYFKYPFQEVDTVHIKIPAGYSLEQLPPIQNIKTSFANYYGEFFNNEDEIIYARKFELLQNKLDVKLYLEFYEFLKQVIEFDKSKIVLKRI